MSYIALIISIIVKYMLNDYNIVKTLIMSLIDHTNII